MDTNVMGDLGFHEVTDLSVSSGEEVELSDLALLGSALQDAMDAYRSGVLAGPGVDETALRRARRRAVRADAARALRRTVAAGGAA